MWLKKAYEQTVAGGFIPKSTFSAENAIASFGVGKNMVASIRHWALACGVMHEADDGFRIGSLATEILQDGGLDPYAESPSTAWLAHWQLAGRCQHVEARDCNEVLQRVIDRDVPRQDRQPVLTDLIETRV